MFSFDFLLFTTIDIFILRIFNLTLLVLRRLVTGSEIILCLPLDGLEGDRFVGGIDASFATGSLAGRCGGGLRRRVDVTGSGTASGVQGLGIGGLSGGFRDLGLEFDARPTVANDRHHGALNAMWRRTWYGRNVTNKGALTDG